MEIRAEVIELIIDENTDGSFRSRRQAEIVKKKVRKLAKQGRLNTNFFNNAHKDQVEWAYRIFSANTLLGDYSWWGWETRSGWAWKLANKDWFYPRWNGKRCKLLVLAEQGIGDEILFISCAKDLAKDADVFWEVDSRLIPILERSIPEVNWVSRWKNEALREPYELSDHRGEYDAFIPAGNVAKIYRQSKNSFPRVPFLIPEQEKAEAWKEKIRGIGFVNQSGARLEKKADVCGDHDLHHHGKLYRSCRDFDDFISLVSVLDHVNAVPSAVVHVCGAVGQTCNVIKPEKVLGEMNTLLKWYYKPRRMDWYGNHVSVYESVHDFNRRARAVA